MALCIHLHLSAVAQSGEDEAVPQHAREVANALGRLVDFLNDHIIDPDDDLVLGGDLLVEGDLDTDGDADVAGDLTLAGDMMTVGDITVGGDLTVTGVSWDYTGDDWITIDHDLKTIIHDTEDTLAATLEDAGKVIATIALDAKRHVIGATYASPAGGDTIEDYTDDSPWIVVDTVDNTIEFGGPYGGDPSPQVFAIKDSTGTRIGVMTFDSKGIFDTWVPDF